MTVAGLQGIERYQQHQTLGNNLSALQEAPTAADSKPNSANEPQEDFSLSERQWQIAQVANQFRVSDMNFPEVLELRQTLFDSGLISLGDANTLTLVTQTYPDNARFDLNAAIDQHLNSEEHLYLKFSLDRLKTLSANLEAAGTSQ